MIYEFMEKKGVSKQQIPDRLDVLTETLEDLVGTGNGRILGSAHLLEGFIIERLCRRLLINYEQVNPGYFPERCRRVKEIYVEKNRSK